MISLRGFRNHCVSEGWTVDALTYTWKANATVKLSLQSQMKKKHQSQLPPLFQFWHSAPSLFRKHQNPLKFYVMPIPQYLHVSVKLELISLIADSKIALGYSRLCCLKSHLVTCQPALVAKHQRSTYRRTGDIKIHVAAHVDVLPFVSCLNFSTLFPKAKRKKETHILERALSSGNSIKSVTLTPCNRFWRQSICIWRVIGYITFSNSRVVRNSFIYR